MVKHQIEMLQIYIVPKTKCIKRCLGCFLSPTIACWTSCKQEINVFTVKSLLYYLFLVL